MNGEGRPLRFLAFVLGGWVAARTAMLWPVAIVPLAAAKLPVGSPGAVSFVVEPRLALATDRSAMTAGPAPTRAVSSRPGVRPAGDGSSERPTAPAPAVPATREGQVASGPTGSGAALIAAPLSPTPIGRGRSRLAGSAWVVARAGGDGALLASQFGGRLGASQAGARLTYALGNARRVALSARIATPLRGRGREAAFGVDWQPTRLPLHLLAERRVSLDGQRGGPTLLVIGGVDPTRVAAGFRLEGYAQAGGIVRDGVEAFGDGAARLTRVVARIGGARIDLGGGAWGAAQRGVRRLDAGPTLGAVVPVVHTALRLTLDWRARIAGNARPDSGPALSIGTDF